MCLKNTTSVDILAMSCADLLSSSITGISSGAYFTTIEQLCKNGEGFNLYSPVAVMAALPEEVRGHMF